MRVVTLNLQRDWRGGEHQVWLLARELLRLGVDQTVIARSDSPLARRLSDLPGGPELIEARSPIAAFRRLPRSRGEQLIFHAHTGNTVPIAVLGAGSRHRSVITRHLDRPVKPWLYRRADRIVAVSPAVREMLLAAGIAAERVELIPTAIDLQRRIDAAEVDELRAEHGLGDGVTVSLTIAAMAAEKDPVTPVRALAYLPRDHIHVHVGDGPLRTEVERVAAETGVADRLLLPGFDPSPDRWFGVADVCIVSSRWESVGMVALDAFLFGVPVIASDIPGTADLLADRRSCLRFPVGNAEALARSIVTLDEDRSLASGLVEEGRRRLAGYDIRASARRYAALYRQLGNGA